MYRNEASWQSVLSFQSCLIMFRDQGILIRSLCCDAIQILELTLVTKEAWPELHRAAEYRVEVFTEAARALQKTDVRYRALRKRIADDEDYASVIGVWVRLLLLISFYADATTFAHPDR